VWAPLSWALLLADRSAEYLQEMDDARMLSVLQEAAPFALLLSLHHDKQISFFTNHLECALQHRPLTNVEQDTLRNFLEFDEGVSEVLLVAALLAQSRNDEVMRNQLLARISPNEMEAMLTEIEQTIAHVAPIPPIHAHLTALLALLDVRQENLPDYDVRSDPNSQRAAMVRELVAFAHQAGVLQVREYMHESLRWPEFHFKSEYEATDGTVMRFSFGSDSSGSAVNEGAERGITSDWLYGWLESYWGHRDPLQGDDDEMPREIIGNGWESSEAELHILAMMTEPGIALEEKGRAVLADWYVDRFHGRRDNYVTYYAMTPPSQGYFDPENPHLEDYLRQCWESTAACYPELAHVLVGPLLMLLPHTPDTLKLQILDAGVADAVALARSQRSINETIRIAAGLIDEQVIRSNLESTFGANGIWLGSFWKVPVFPNNATPFAAAKTDSSESPVQTVVRELRDQLGSDEISFPTISGLKERWAAGENVHFYHRDIVLAAMADQDWIQIPAETINRIRGTLASSPDQGPEVIDSWTELLASWDQLGT
jgi:hypothetical protein